MKKRFIILCSLFTLLTSLVHGQQVSKEEAATRASEFFSERSSIRKAVKGNIAKPSLDLSYTAKTKNENCFYVFNNSNGGFVIVSGDDVTSTDILGYSDKGNFDINEIPDNFRFWLEMYKEEISSSIKSQNVSGKQSQRKGLRKSNLRRDAARQDVEPLIQTRWNQKAPFYNYCPIENDTHCMAGCVATAMAQVMNYWKWPIKGNNYHSYNYKDANNDNKTLYSNFSEHTYDWSLINKRIASDFTKNAEKNAVAQLMFDCGVSTNMVYGAQESSTYASYIPNALTSYFNYNNTVIYAEKRNSTDSNWKNMLYNELSSGRPVIYGGQNSTASNAQGHQFVCDGYDALNDKFHFNWGWSGTYDGYFSLDAITPGSYNFNYIQNAVYGIEPLNFSISSNTIYTGGHSIGEDIVAQFNVYVSENASEDIHITTTSGVLSTNTISKTSKGSNTVTITLNPSYGKFVETITVSNSDKSENISVYGEVGYSIDISNDEDKGYAISNETGIPGDSIEILTECYDGYALSDIKVYGTVSNNLYEVSPEINPNIDYYKFLMPNEPVRIELSYEETDYFSIDLLFDEDKGYAISNETGIPGDSIEILTECYDGYYLSGIQVYGTRTYSICEVSPEINQNNDYYKFLMPDEPVNIEVYFDEIPILPVHTLTWMVNGSQLTTTSYTEGDSIEMPTPTSFEGYSFLGWTTEANVNTNGEGISFISKNTSITEDVSLYAVYAKASQIGESEQKELSFTYSAHEGWTVDGCYDASSYYVFGTGAKVTSPIISCNSIDAISVRIRTYGGTGYNIFNAYFNGQLIGSCTAPGKSLSNTSFNNIQSTSGTGSLEFSSTTTNGEKAGPGVSEIVITYSSAGTTYSNYTTTPNNEQPETYTLTWMSDDSVFTTTEVEEGNNIVLPAEPEADDFIFMGWTNTSTVSPDGEGIVLITNNSVITSDSTFYAVFANEDLEFTTTPTPVVKDITITWISNNDVFTTTTEKEGSTITLPADPVFEGYSFMGWTTATEVNSNGNGITYIDSSYVANEDTYFYGVFAKADGEGQGGQKTLDFKYSSHEGWDISTSSDKTSYYVLITGSSIASPSITCTSIDSIAISARTYGGKQYGTINVNFCGTNIASCTATSTNKTKYNIAEINDAVGTGSVVFTPGNSSSSNGPGVYDIHIVYSSGSVAYSGYTTHPFSPVTVKYTLTLVDKGETFYTAKVNEGTALLTACGKAQTPVNDDINYPGYSFLGWSFVANSSLPEMVTDADTIYSDLTLYAIYSKTGESSWRQSTTLHVGDEAVIAQIDDENGPCELSSFSTGSTVYGVGSNFTDVPNGTYTYIVKAGTQNGTIAFQNKVTGKYLYWPVNKNSVSEQDSLSDYSSWKLLQSNERGLLQNAVRDNNDKDRYLLWNKTNTRFASYIYKSPGNNNGAYYYYTIFYIKEGGLKYDLEVPQIIPPSPDDDVLAGLEVPASKKDGSTLLIEHTTNYNGQEIRTYCYEYDKTKYHTRWVAFRFDGNTRQSNTSRNDNFMDDPELPSDYWITNKGFGSITIGGTSYNLDRGHICSSADRLYSSEANKQTFYMSNMSPQISNFNQGYWNNLEQHVQSLGRNNSFSDTLYVVKGGTIYGTNTIGYVDRTYNGDTRRVVIPKYYYMALLRVRHDAVKGDGYNAIAILAEHKAYSSSKISSHIDHVINIDSLEKITGIDFFHKLQDDVENAVESMAITNDVLTDWGFTTTGNADNDEFFYHNPATEIKLSKIDNYAYSTYYGDQRKVVPNGVEAYIARQDENHSDNLIMTRLQGNVIPARCGVILRSENGGTYTLNDAKGYPSDNAEGNLLVGWTADTEIFGSSEYAFYALNYKEDTNGNKHVGFFAPKGAGTPHGSFTAKAGKAYVRLGGITPTTSPASFNLVWDEADDICPQYTLRPASPYIYDITGRKLNKTEINSLPKGMYIINGKKILVK